MDKEIDERINKMRKKKLYHQKTAQSSVLIAACSTHVICSLSQPVVVVLPNLEI